MQRLVQNVTQSHKTRQWLEIKRREEKGMCTFIELLTILYTVIEVQSCTMHPLRHISTLMQTQ